MKLTANVHNGVGHALLDSHSEVRASVVIPVFNRVRTIRDAVTSALSQQTTFPFNVIVVDNHSTDGTTEVLNEIANTMARAIRCRSAR